MKITNLFILICVFISNTCLTTVSHAEIRVGIAGPLSGSALTTGEQQEVGALSAIDQLNDKGGLLGEEILAISVDDACEPRQAIAVAQQLVNEDVVLVVGHHCSGCALAVSEIYEQAGVITITPAATNPKVTDEGGSNVFRVIGRDDQQGTIAGDYLADNYGNRNIAIIHDGEDYGMGLAEFTKRQLNKRGVKEVVFHRYTKNQKDYHSIINRLIDKKVDALYAGGYEADIGIILRQAKNALPGIRLFSGDSLVTPEFLTYAGEAGEGTYFTFGPDMRLNKEATEVVEIIRHGYNYEPEGFTLYSYAVVQAWAQAVKQAGSLNPDTVITALRTGSFDTVLGEIGFDERGDVTGISPFVWYVHGKEGYTRAE